MFPTLVAKAAQVTFVALEGVVSARDIERVVAARVALILAETASAAILFSRPWAIASFTFAGLLEGEQAAIYLLTRSSSFRHIPNVVVHFFFASVWFFL